MTTTKASLGMAETICKLKAAIAAAETLARTPGQYPEALAGTFKRIAHDAVDGILQAMEEIAK